MQIFLCHVKNGKPLRNTIKMDVHDVPNKGDTVISFGEVYEVTDVIRNYDKEEIHIHGTRVDPVYSRCPLDIG